MSEWVHRFFAVLNYSVFQAVQPSFIEACSWRLRALLVVNSLHCSVPSVSKGDGSLPLL